MTVVTAFLLAASAQSQAMPPEAKPAEDQSLCVAGRASDQRRALLVPQGKHDQSELDAVAGALLKCSPAQIDAIRGQKQLKSRTIADAMERLLIQRIPAGNG